MSNVVAVFAAVSRILADAFPFFKKPQKSGTQLAIEGWRQSMDKLKDLDAAEKEKLAENVRRLWVSEANLALVTSETDRREGKKLQRQSDKDEGDLVRLLAEIGVGRYSPEHQQMRNAVDAEVAVMLEDSRQMNAELDELHRPIRAKLTALENSLDDLRRQV